MPRILLGVPCFAEPRELLTRALRSFLEDEVAVVAVDNGAATDVKAVLAEMEPSIEILRNPTNIYVNPAWNQLAAHFLASDSEILVLANADLIAAPHWSASLLLRRDHSRSKGDREFWFGRALSSVNEASRAQTASIDTVDGSSGRSVSGAFFAMTREAVSIAFPIPPELLIHCGDDWIHSLLSEAGFRQRTLYGMAVWHEGFVSGGHVPEFHSMTAHDRVAWSRLSKACRSLGEIERQYVAARDTPSDIHEHIPMLSMYAKDCERVTELGVGLSTWGLLHGRPKRMRCYDIRDKVNLQKKVATEAGIDFDFQRVSSLSVGIDETDLLFIDTIHTYAQLRQELALHGPKVRKHIVLHDTETYGTRDEGDVGPGLWPAVEEFIAAHPEWGIEVRLHNNNGLTVLTRTQRTRIVLGVPCFAEDHDLLVRALRSFCEPGVDVVAIDNGGAPAVKSALDEMGATITVLRNPENVYVNPAWNQLAARFLESNAEILVIANADLVVSPGWSSSLLQRFDRARGRREVWVGRRVGTEAEAAGAVRPSGESTNDPKHTAGAFFALTREAVTIAFPIPPELRLWYGDTWIQTVLAEAGFQSVTLRDVVAWHAEKVSSSRLPELAEMVTREGVEWNERLHALARERGSSQKKRPERPTRMDDVLTLLKRPISSTRFVSAFFRLRDRTVDEDAYFRWFSELAASGLPILLFLDRQLAERAPKHPNVQVELTDLESLWPFQHDDGTRTLPGTRSSEKDARGSLLLINAKLDLLALARELDDSSSHFAWIDFAVMKVVKNPASFLDRLRALHPPSVCVLAPGCWNKETAAARATDDDVNWRFCGGFLLVDRESIPELVERYHAVFRRMQQITWEVNTWAEMEREGQRFDWYQADHDDSIIDIPRDGDTPMNRLERRATAARGKHKEEKSTVTRICLVMIVKNESAIIERCLSAALPFIDKWVITDTGSTDGTFETIQRFFKEHQVPGKLVRTTFKNFAQARNESLEAARAYDGWDYALLIDADMVLRGSLDKRALTAPAYRLQQLTGALHYWNTRLVRRDVVAQYVGVTHEFLSVPGDTPPNLDSCSIDDRNDGGSKGDKGDRDIRLLMDGLTREPDNARYMFYLANTYREMGRQQEAIQWYTRRIAAGGWDEEVWASHYGIARSHAALNDEPALVLACFDAYNFRPTRAEPLALLARWWREHGKSDAAILLAEQVARMPCPDEILFVEKDVYERKNAPDVAISGFYSKLPARRQAGYDACARLTIDRDANVRGEARGNFVHYVKTARELCGAELRAIDWKSDDGYAPMNPSVLVVGDRRLVLVRTVNYTVAEGQYPTIDGSGIIRTKNWILEMNKTWKPTGSPTLLTDATGLPRTSYPVEGFEDCRLWLDGDKFRASAVVRDLGDGRCEQCILTIDHEWKITDVRVIRDYEHDRAQKNWMPILGQPGSFLYLCDPTIVIDCAPEKTTERFRITDLDENLTELRGGSQVIPHGDSFLCLVHEVVHTPGRIYLHRFVRLTEKLEIRSISEPFYFERKGIEFAAGLARDGDRLVVSFGVNDASAHLAFFDSAAVDRLISTQT